METGSGELGDPRVGRVIAGGYRIVGWLAEGNLGPVYAAEQLATGARVAIKLLIGPGLREPELGALLRLECELLKKVAHPNLVEVLEVGTTRDGTPFVVTEYFAGESLAVRLQSGGALSALEALRIAGRVASALSAAHRQGIVHTALRPRSILLCRLPGESDVVKLLGFGLGKLSAEQSRIVARVRPDTGAYFAPEQLKPRARVDHRADQFALGAIAYQMLTGVHPFGAEHRDSFSHRILSAEPIPPSELCSAVPSVIDAVLGRALNKDPLERYANMAELGRALENAAAAASIQSRARRPMSSPEPVSSSYRLRPSEAELPADPELHARRLASRVREAYVARDLDAAVARAEELYEHGLSRPADARVLDVLRTHFTLLDRIFSERLGPLDRPVKPNADASSRPELMPAARAMLDAARAGTTLGELVERARMPRHDAVRLIAGMLRRGVLEIP